MGPEKYFIERFNKFLTNDWVHLEKKVAALEAKLHMLMAGSGIIIGLMIYAVTKWRYRVSFWVLSGGVCQDFGE